MRQVAAIIEEQGHEPLRWDKPGLFIAGKYTLETLENIAKKVDAALFIFSEDDKLWYRNKDIVGSVRDNVLIEYGLFCGNISRMKACICCVNNPQIASDLNGITYINLTHKARAEIDIIEWLKSLTHQSDTKDEYQSTNNNFAHINNRYIEYKKRLIADATMGNSESRYILGLKYYTGDIAAFDRNYDEAYKWTKLAVTDESYPAALDLMGILYYRGCGVTQSFTEAFVWHKKSADNGYSHACGQTGFMYRRGVGCEQNFEKAMEYYKKGIDLGQIELYNALGLLYELNIKDFYKAAESYVKASAFSAEACYRLGMLYQNGIDGKKSDYLEAGKWFREAAERGHTDAQKYLGDLHYFGNGFPIDFKQAKKWFEQAASKGNVDSQYTLAYFYLHGLDVEKNDEIALAWFKKSSEQSHLFAQRHAGDIYLRQKKFTLAFKMFKLAADQGDSISQHKLGDLYALGLGCEEDYGMAIKYYKLSANQNNYLAKKSLEFQSIPLLEV